MMVSKSQYGPVESHSCQIKLISFLDTVTATGGVGHCCACLVFAWAQLLLNSLMATLWTVEIIRGKMMAWSSDMSLSTLGWTPVERGLQWDLDHITSFCKGIHKREAAA